MLQSRMFPSFDFFLVLGKGMGTKKGIILIAGLLSFSVHDRVHCIFIHLGIFTQFFRPYEYALCGKD